MNKFKMVCLAIALSQGSNMLAGGLLTNTNQHIAFNRMLSREASIAIDGVYYNPAGVAFLGEGHLLPSTGSWSTKTASSRTIMRCLQTT